MNEALRAGARAGKFALSLGSFVGVMKHACVSLSPFVVHVFDRSVLIVLFASSFGTVGRVVSGAYSLEGTYAIFVPKTKDQLAKSFPGIASSGTPSTARFCSSLLPTASKERRNRVVDYRWNMQQTPQTVAKDFTKQKGFNARVRATCHLIT